MGTKTPKQPEALRLAALLGIGCLSRKDEKATSKELRRLHYMVLSLENHLEEQIKRNRNYNWHP